MKRKLVAPEIGVNQSLEEEGLLTDSFEKVKEKSLLSSYEKRQQFISVSDQIAESHFYFRNYRYPKGNELYPDALESDFRIVSKAYPYAKGGLLLVDEPRTEKESLKMYEKQKKLKKLLSATRYFRGQPVIPSGIGIL